MRKLISQVRAFHEKFDLPVVEEPRFPPMDRQKLRLALIEEEFDELKASVHLQDLQGYADALGDLCYVIAGAALEHGIPLAEVFDEIHRSNLTKLWPDGTVHKRADGKVLKPPTYTPPDLERILLKVARGTCAFCGASTARDQTGMWKCLGECDGA